MRGEVDETGGRRSGGPRHSRSSHRPHNHPSTRPRPSHLHPHEHRHHTLTTPYHGGRRPVWVLLGAEGSQAHGRGGGLRHGTFDGRRHRQGHPARPCQPARRQRGQAPARYVAQEMRGWRVCDQGWGGLVGAAMRGGIIIMQCTHPFHSIPPTPHRRRRRRRCASNRPCRPAAGHRPWFLGRPGRIPATRFEKSQGGGGQGQAPAPLRRGGRAPPAQALHARALRVRGADPGARAGARGAASPFCRHLPPVQRGLPTPQRGQLLPSPPSWAAAGAVAATHGLRRGDPGGAGGQAQEVHSGRGRTDLFGPYPQRVAGQYVQYMRACWW